MPQFAGWAFSDLTITGPDPFSSNASANSSAPGNSTITINTGVTPTQIDLTDGDSEFTEGDSDQRYQGPADFNGGVGYNVGDRIETEYSYIIRPQGSSDPADNVTIYMLEINAVGQGIAADGQLVPGVTYDIISIDSDSPVVNYSAMFACFGCGTRIATPSGYRMVEDLALGDLVDTFDHGPQPLRWIARRRLVFGPDSDEQKPILLRAGCLGAGLPVRDLVLSPHHRVMITGQDVYEAFGSTEVLKPAKALLPMRGVRRMVGRQNVTYYSLFFDRHQIIRAEGAPVESFYPGPVALRLLTPRQRDALVRICPAIIKDPDTGYGPPARPFVKRRPAEAFLRNCRREMAGKTIDQRASAG